LFYSKDDTLWRFTNFDLDPGYPKTIDPMPERPGAGAFIRDQYGITRLLLFGVRRTLNLLLLVCLTTHQLKKNHLVANINWRDVQRKKCCKHCRKAPWHNGPYKNKHLKQHDTRKTTLRNRHLELTVVVLCVFYLEIFVIFKRKNRITR